MINEKSLYVNDKNFILFYLSKTTCFVMTVQLSDRYSNLDSNSSYKYWCVSYYIKLFVISFYMKVNETRVSNCVEYLLR